MSQSRWKYWIENGTAHIRKEDLPSPYEFKAEMKEGPKVAMTIHQRMNPDYYEFLAEILSVTGKKEIIVHDGKGNRHFNDPDW